MNAALKELPETQDDPLVNATPAMRQYLEIKHRHEECLLFYRMGDFYELFFHDAIDAANILDIALTKRGKHAGADIPMCGVPVHSHEMYLQKLISSGRKVAICEQLETPEEAKKRSGHKAVVNRGVVRVVTPGTITEENLLSPSSAHYLAALAESNGQWALAWLELSTGAFQVCATSAETALNDVARIAPRELLMSDALFGVDGWQTFCAEYEAILSPLAKAHFSSTKAERLLKQHYHLNVLDSLGELGKADIAACGALLEYIQLTQLAALPRLDLPQKQQSNAAMVIDAATRRNLELSHTLGGERKGSLLQVIDRTVSNAGGRLLAERLLSPLTDVKHINTRLEAVQWAQEQSVLQEHMRTALKSCPDIERALSRLHLGRGGPRDMQAILRGLQAVQAIRQSLLLQNTKGDLRHQQHCGHYANMLNNHSSLVDQLNRALKNEVPMLARDGNFIAEGYRDDVDALRSLRDNAKQVIAQMQADYAKETGIPTLKVKFNNVLGYFIDITAVHADKVPEHFIHRQSLANNVRYTTTELSDMASKIAEAGGQLLELEQQIFAELLEVVQVDSSNIIASARALAELDVTTALAQLAIENTYTKPHVDGSLAFAIEGGRHPVVEAMLRKGSEAAFVANDCDLSEVQRLWLLTGPNMAGKSTFLRQNALIAIMAQMGSFVPAASAHIGVVDRLFSRVGAADELARGRSTFMVEMVETATILNQSTERSLVILDEIGRGTATYDGLSIAWAVVEHLHEAVQCRGLFATHYHELTQLAQKLASLECHTMQVKEWQGEVIFLHQVVAGTADRSYGIHVAQLAGLPKPVVARAKTILAELESGKSEVSHELAETMPLFAHAAQPVAVEQSQPIRMREALESVNPDDLTPREALEKLYELKRHCEERRDGAI